MRRYHLFLIFILCFQESVFSKREPILIIKNEIKTFNLKSYTQYHFDTKSEVKVSKLKNTLFQKKNNDFDFGTKSYPIWVKLKIDNKSKNEHFVLTLKNKLIPNIEVFLEEDEDIFEIKKSFLRGSAHSFPIHLKRKDVKNIFIKSKGGPPFFPLFLSTKSYFEKKFYLPKSIVNDLFVVLFPIFLISTFVFIFNKQFFNLWVTVFVATGILRILFLAGLIDPHSIINKYFIFVWGLSLISFSKVIHFFMKYKINSKYHKSFFKFCPIIIFSGSILSFIVSNKFGLPIMGLMEILLFSFIFFLKAKNNQDSIFYTAFSFILIVFLLNTVFLSNLSFAEKTFCQTILLSLIIGLTIYVRRQLRAPTVIPFLIFSILYDASTLQIFSLNENILNLSLLSTFFALIGIPFDRFEFYKSFKEGQYNDLKKELEQHEFDLEMKNITVEHFMDITYAQKKTRDKILNNLHQGIVSFDSSGLILEGATDVAYKLLEIKNDKEKVNDLKIEDILNLGDENKNIFKNGYVFLFSNKIEFNDFLKLAPKKFNGTQDKFIPLEFIPLFKDNSKELDKIILIISDKTLENEQAKAVEERSHQLEMRQIELEYMMDHVFEQKSRRDLLVNHLQQGFLCFRKDGVIEEGATKSCEELFERSLFESEVQKVKIWDIFDKNKNLIEKWVHTIWEGNFQFKDLVSLGPSSFQGTKGKFIKLEFRPIYSTDNKTIDKIIMVASDKTKEKELEDKIERDNEEAFFIKICLQSPEDFLDLMNDTYSFLLDYPNITNHEKEKERIFRYFHTMKARYGQFHLSEIAKTLNRLEEFLENNDWKNLNVQMEVLDKEINNLFTKHRLLVQAANKLLIDEGESIRIKELFSTLDNFESIDTFKNYIQTNYILKDIKSSFKKFETLVEDISKEQNKIIFFELRGDNILVNIEPYQDFLSSTIHLFRNIVDHGIESKETRLEKNKDEFGTIIIKSQRIKKNIVLTIEDDGAGIDPTKIKEILIEKKLKTPSELNHLSDKEVLDFIFLSGFSTAEKVGPLSGRGVGTDAVRHEVNNLGGTITVESKLGVKTIFTIILPIII